MIVVKHHLLLKRFYADSLKPQQKEFLLVLNLQSNNQHYSSHKNNEKALFNNSWQKLLLKISAKKTPI